MPHRKSPLRLAVFVSGRGSNLRAILEAIERGELNARVEVVWSNHPKAPALEIAKNFGIQTYAKLKPHEMSSAAYDKLILDLITPYEVDLIALAGYFRILSPSLIRAFRWKIVNIHPSLLPSFPGLHAQKQAVEYGVKISGCTVHFVTEALDAGPIIAQRAVSLFDDDTEETLAERILFEEHKLYPEVLELFAKQRIIVEDGKKPRVRILPEKR